MRNTFCLYNEAVRVFIGIPATNEIIQQVQDFQGKYQALGKIRWIPERNLHLTLVPPWEIDDPDEIIRRLENIPKLSVETIHFETISFGPRKNPDSSGQLALLRLV